MKKQQLAALCLAAGLALTGITSPVSAAQTDAGISISADSISNPQRRMAQAQIPTAIPQIRITILIPQIQLFPRSRRIKLLR